MDLFFRLLLKVAIIKVLNHLDLVKFNKHLQLHLVHFIFSLKQLLILLYNILSLHLKLFAQVAQVIVLDLKISFG